MKPNGRRRWRRRAKNLRHMLRHEWALILEHATPKVRAQLLHAQKHHSSRPLPPLPAREFSPQSLVGMSQGARKRAARSELTGGHRVGHWTELLPSIVSAVYRGPHYRLGERLRPCPGCMNCVSCSWERDFFLSLVRPCNGSGVLPAKRHRRCGWWLQTRTAKNATQRCGMPLTFGGWLDCQNCGGSGWLMGRKRP